jgi:hypothetical protein
MFQLPAWVAWQAGLQRLLELAEADLKYEVGERKKIDTDVVYQLRSLISGYRTLLAVPEEVDINGLALQAESGGTADGKRTDESREDSRHDADEIDRRDSKRIAIPPKRRVRSNATGY